ncbi:MAG: hypothetical protein DRO06_04125 [Thermoproteota archaeon]|nr:MAG: hypothetical protein DRO06_04125 [Candidatus Korarchaeota archaeon]
MPAEVDVRLTIRGPRRFLTLLESSAGPEFRSMGFKVSPSEGSLELSVESLSLSRARALINSVLRLSAVVEAALNSLPRRPSGPRNP